MDDLQDAIVVMGVAHTHLFNGTEGIELIMLDLASGQDFTLPITEEQAALIFQYKNAGARDGETEGLRPSKVAAIKDADKIWDPGEIGQL
jgi:hypothetical protein